MFLLVRHWQKKAEQYRAQALRLKATLDAHLHDHAEELRKLQRDFEWVMDLNAGLAIEIAARDHELSTLKKAGD